MVSVDKRLLDTFPCELAFLVRLIRVLTLFYRPEWSKVLCCHQGRGPIPPTAGNMRVFFLSFLTTVAGQSL